MNTCNVYIVETCPPNRIGIFGSLVNTGIVAGLSVYFLQGVFIPNAIDKTKLQSTQIWRYIYIFPIPFSIINILLLLCKFDHDSLQFLIKKKKRVEALIVIKRLYKAEDGNDYIHNQIYEELTENV